MARKAIHLNQTPKHQAVVVAHKAKSARRAALAVKTFEGLTAKQKDHLLKTLALKAGLISESED